MSIFYLIFIGLALYFCFRYDGIEEYDQHKEHRLWLMCGYLILLTGFSYGLGGDKFVYMEDFEHYPSDLSDIGNNIWIQLMTNGQMPLWTLTNLILKYLFNSFYAVQLVQSAALNISLCYVMSKYTKRYFLFLLVYFFTLQYFIFNTEIMREGFAMAFILIGFHTWMNGKRWIYFVLLPISIMFHISAIVSVLFPLVTLIKIKITWKSLAIAFFMAFSIWLLSDLLLGKVMMAVLGGMGALVSKVLTYSIQGSNIFGFIRASMTYLILPFFIMYTSAMYEESDDIRAKKEKLIAYMLVLGVLATSFVGFIRIYNYIQLFYLAMLADFIYITFHNKTHLILRTGVLACTVFLLSLTYFKKYKTTNKFFYEFYYPYTCILDEDKSVYIREITHIESTFVEEKDNNVRDIK